MRLFQMLIGKPLLLVAFFWGINIDYLSYYILTTWSFGMGSYLSCIFYLTHISKQKSHASFFSLSS
jgi:hypothetical protein